MSPPGALDASNARPAVSEKYKAAPKKVVSDFTKEQLARMHFLNRRGIGASGPAALSAGFPPDYEASLMNSLRIAQDFLTFISICLSPE